jgi:hypothetical protein
MLDEHLLTSSRGVPHTHLRSVPSHPYWLVMGSVCVAHAPHVTRSVHAVVVQHVLPPVHAKSEFCPIEGIASAQHCVASIEVVPCVVVWYRRMSSCRQGNIWYVLPARSYSCSR